MNFFQKIATTVCEEMKKFFSNVQQAQFLYFGQKEPTLRLFVQSKNNEDLHLFRDGLEFDGVALSLRPTLQLSVCHTKCLTIFFLTSLLRRLKKME